jgi:preprotein translocase subunit SecE
MNSIRNAAAAVAAAALLAACSSGSHGSHAAASAPSAAAASRSAAAGTSGSPGSGPSGSPAVTSPAGSTSAGPLTMKQAERAYARIVGPGNAMLSKLSSAASGTAPFSEFRTEALAYVRELRAEIGKFRAVRWPATAQSRISTMISTTFAADIGCLQAQAAAGSFTGVESVSNSNQNCAAAENSTIPTTLPSLLG